MKMSFHQSSTSFLWHALEKNELSFYLFILQFHFVVYAVRKGFSSGASRVWSANITNKEIHS